MPRRPRPLPADLRGRAFTTGECLAAGVSEGRLRRSDLSSPTRGVWSTEQAPSLLERCRQVAVVLPAGSAFSHVTALRLAGIELPHALERDTRLHVRVPPGSPVPARAGFAFHRGRQGVVTKEHDGVRVTSPEQAWQDVGAVLDVDDLVVVGDSMLRRRRPVSTLDAMTAQVGSTKPRTRGVARLRRALDDLRPGTDSSMETRTRLLLVRSGLPCPVVNRPVLDRVGRFVALPDMSFVEQRVALEYDGDVHRTDRPTWMKDIRRKESLQDAGWLVLTATADDVLRSPERLVLRVASALRSRGARL